MIENILKMLEHNPSVGLVFKELPKDLIEKAQEHNLHVNIEEEVSSLESARQSTYYIIFQKKVEIEVLNLDLVVKNTFHKNI